MNKKIILFSAQDIKDNRKGYKYFVKIKNKLSKEKDIFFISLGNLYLKLQSQNSENYKHIDFCSNKESAEIYSLLIFIYLPQKLTTYLYQFLKPYPQEML